MQDTYRWKDAVPSPAHRYILPVLLREIGRPGPAPPMRVLDVGCGNGYVASRIAALGHQVIGVDVSPNGIEIARRAHPGIRFDVLSLYDERFEEIVGGALDCVVAVEVVEHLFFPRRLFEVSYRVLRAGGSLIITTPYHGYLKNLAISLVDGWDRHFSVDSNGGHIKFFSKMTLQHMALDCGFRRPHFRGAGRLPWLRKSLVMSVQK